MDRKHFLGLALGLIGLVSVGCSSTPGVFRAQSPGAPDAAGGPAVVQAGGPISGTPGHPCEQCGCTDGTCSHCWPQHRFWSHYTPPDAPTCCLDSMGCCCLPHCCNLPSCGVCGDHGPLVYPTNPTPGAIVQYPYYTCKGPDDFFHQSANNGQSR